MDQSHVDQEVELMRQKIMELGSKQEDGSYSIPFGVLYEKTTDIFEVRFVNALLKFMLH